jgi:Tfp pilus assembly protein PilN
VSVRVNLLPREAYARQVAARQRAGVVGGFLALLLVLGLAYWWQSTQLTNARDELAEEEAVLAALESELASLQEYEELQQRIDQDEQLIASALGDEVSFAAILQDVAAVMPSDAQFEQLGISVNSATPEEGIERPSWGTLTAQGSSLANHAPGLERLLLQFDKIAAFHDLFFANSSLDDPDDDIVSFNIEAELGPEILTGRYQDGIPEELR